MKPLPEAEAWLAAWRRLSESAGAGSASGTRAPLEEAGAAFARFANEFASLTRPSAGAPESARAEFAARLNQLAERFVASTFPAWPAPPGADAEWARALEAWSKVLSGIASDTARHFAARLAGAKAPGSLRETFDAWIDAAEAAFQASAHGDAFIAGQARLINEFVLQRRRQQELVERAARAAGMPTRSEVDALHDAVRALKEARAAPASAAPPRAPGKRASAPRKRAPRRTPRPRR